MPEYTVSVLQDMLNECGLPLKGTKIAVFGVSYKKDVDDPRESPFYEIRKILLAKGAELNVYDSWYKDQNTVSSVEEALAEASAILIITAHTDIIDQLKSTDISATNVSALLDGRNCLDEEAVNDWGITYRGIGRRVQGLRIY